MSTGTFMDALQSIAEPERCSICQRVLNDPADATTKDCGGDCLKCMAEAGDPDCIQEMKLIDQRPV